MTLRDLLLRAYPRSWRAEYGEELAAMLAQDGLSLGVAADVLLGAARQHLDRDEPWKICGCGLAAWYLLIWPLAPVLRSRPVLLWYGAAGFLFVLAAGAWTVARNRLAIARATLKAVQASMAGQLALLVLFLRALPQTSASTVLGHTVYYWFAKTMVVNLTMSVACGFIGVALGRTLRPRTH